MSEPHTAAISPQDVYADMMKTTFAPALRAAGLRGSSGRFELPSDIYWAQLGSGMRLIKRQIADSGRPDDCAGPITTLPGGVRNPV
jgi:hypothetical protein